MAKIHITGATGYVGALLYNYLIALGHQVDLPNYRLPDVQPKSIDAEIVIHLAASGGGTEHKPRPGWDDFDRMRNININGMKALLYGLKKPTTKIIFLSSTAVYGKFQDSHTVNEQSPLLPVSEYGKQKAEAEKILMESDSEWLIFRPSGIFGPSAERRFGNSFVNVVLEKAIQTREINIWGGDQKIDTLYILDLISIILRSCAGEWHSREIFNVAGEIVTIENMLNFLAEAMQNSGIKCAVTKKPFSGKPAVLTDTTKIRKTYRGWKTTPLSCSMHSLLSSYIRKH